MRVAAFLCAALLAGQIAEAQAPAARGQQTFVSRCAGCHGTTGNGGELGPAIAARIPTRTDQDLTTLFREGLPTAGMPSFSALTGAEVTDLIGFLRTLRPPNGSAPERAKVALRGGGTLEGLVMNQSAGDMQLLGDDRRIHLLRKTGDQYRSVTSQAGWASYNGETRGSRYSPLTQISKSNVASLANGSSACPIRRGCRCAHRRRWRDVCDQREQCYALDAGREPEIWHYQRPRTKGLVGNAAGG